MSEHQFMKVGSKWQLFVPADLAYGEKQSGRIPPNSTPIFGIELLSIDDGTGAMLMGFGLLDFSVDSG